MVCGDQVLLSSAVYIYIYIFVELYILHRYIYYEQFNYPIDGSNNRFSIKPKISAVAHIPVLHKTVKELLSDFS